jgi:hypothetical protein
LSGWASNYYLKKISTRDHLLKLHKNISHHLLKKVGEVTSEELEKDLFGKFILKFKEMRQEYEKKKLEKKESQKSLMRSTSVLLKIKRSTLSVRIENPLQFKESLSPQSKRKSNFSKRKSKTLEENDTF